MNTSTTLILFGATGDLAQKKIWKSLFDLFIKKALPTDFSIIGFSRREWDNVLFRDFVTDILVKTKRTQGTETVDEDSIKDFLNIVTYCKGDLFDSASYTALANVLFDADARRGVCSNKMFFLAVQPDAYEKIFTLLAQSGLSTPCAQARTASGIEEVPGTWTRVLVEKPFGSDIHTAQELDATLGSLFHEDQIFRIDHYLAKDTVQNILTFRFQNNVFESVWNRDHIEKIEIDMHEEVDIATRGSLYDGIGALRDVGQNHILQMLALITMDAPAYLDEKNIRQGRINILQRVRPDVDSYVKAQYEGYRSASGVHPESRTETFFSINVSIDNERWKGVPIRLESGKALPQKKTEIRIYFKGGNNVLTFHIQPREGVGLMLLTKKAGFTAETDTREVFIPFALNGSISPDAYEKVIFDAIVGDRTIFTRTEEVAAQWDIISPILEKWKDEEPVVYEKGEYPKDRVRK